MKTKHLRLMQRVYIILFFCFMYLPIAYMIVFSFNQSKGYSLFTGFTFKWYRSLFTNASILHALWVSVEVAILSAIIATVLGMVYNYVPYMILPLYTSMTKIDQSLVEAAQDLGANTTKTLVRVLIPMSVPGISTGITMVFVPAVSTFVISRMLGGGSNLLIGDLIEMQFLGNSYNLNVGSAMSLVLMIIVLLCMSFTSSFDEDEMEGVS